MTLPMHQDAAAAVLRMTMMVLLLLPLMYALSSFPSAAAECPEKCKCNNTFVQCPSQVLYRIPGSIPPDTTHLNLQDNWILKIQPGIFDSLTSLDKLNLQNNWIGEIQPGTFDSLTSLDELNFNYNKFLVIEPNSLAHLTELKYLILQNNRIEELDLEMLKGLTKLKTLNLQNNWIREIQPGTLDSLTSLDELNLNSNYIKVIQPNSLAHLTELKYLFLENNQIEELDLEMLKGLAKLKTLNLQDNRILKIQLGTFDSLTSLDELRIDKNPLTCDCDILYCIKVLNTTDNWAGLETCNFPGEMKKTYLRGLSKDDFLCSPPDVIVVPENKTVSVGEQLQLSCEAEGDPKPSISWTKDDIDLDLGQRVQVFQNNTLFISKVVRTDGGQYKCVASNSRGRKSFKAMVIVNDLVENGCSTMFGVIPDFFIIIIILANCVLYNDLL